MTDLRQSIKRFDAPPRGDVRSLQLVFDRGRGLLPDALPTDLPPTWRERDRILRSATAHEGMWHAALGVKINKIVSQGYRIEGEVSRRVRQGYDTLRRLPFEPTLKKLLRDYWTTNNGAWMEIIHATSARGSAVLAVDHLDSRYCQATGDAEYPCVYIGADGVPRALRAHQVVRMVHMERSDRESLGLGECAAEGAYSFIVELAAINRYLLEKVNGKRPLAIYLVAGGSTSNIEDAIAAAKQQDSDASGDMIAYHYMGAAIVPLPAAEKAALLTIPLSELPNGFDETSRWDKCLLAYAKNLELDVQDIQPIRTGIGTATQSQQLHAKANQIDSFQQALAAALAAQGVVVPGTTFAMGTKDLAERRAHAELAQLRTTDYAAQVVAGWLTPAQAAQLKVDAGDNPAWTLPGPDATPATILTDDDNPAGANDA